jgi:predicted DNA-binding antitoxin AbrB/MazE fold protein
MAKQIEAIYENGVLRPLGAVELEEHQLYRLDVIRTDDEALELDEEFISSCAPAKGRDVSIEEVRQALSAIPGSLSDEIRAERDRR